MTSEILNDEQIDQLLLDAEARLREKATQVSALSNANDLNLESTELKRKVKLPPSKLRHGLDRAGYLKDDNGVAQTNPKALVGTNQKQLSTLLEPSKESGRSRKINDQINAGPSWFGLPKTEITPQLKRDLQLIEMRSVLDPHRHYKKNNRKGKVPTFSQTGTVLEGPTEFYSSRINKRDRAKNFVEEAMATERETGRFKRKYGEIQEAKTSGKKAHYKKLMAKRKRS